MTTPEFTRIDLSGARFERVPLRQASFRAVDFSGSVMRAVSLEGVDIDGDIGGLRINGVDIAPLVEAELRRRQPARAHWNATEPDDLRSAWAAVQQKWSELQQRVEAMPAGTADVSVGAEWSFAQTLRHLLFVTDVWFTVPVGQPEQFHPWGLGFAGMTQHVPEGTHFGLDTAALPSYPELLEARAERVALVTAFLADVAADRLATLVDGPHWSGEEKISLRHGIQVVIEEECEHQRFAERDLDLIAAGAPATPLPGADSWS